MGCRGHPKRKKERKKIYIFPSATVDFFFGKQIFSSALIHFIFFCYCCWFSFFLFFVWKKKNQTKSDNFFCRIKKKTESKKFIKKKATKQTKNPKKKLLWYINKKRERERKKEKGKERERKDKKRQEKKRKKYDREGFRSRVEQQIKRDRPILPKQQLSNSWPKRWPELKLAASRRMSKETEEVDVFNIFFFFVRFLFFFLSVNQKPTRKLCFRFFLSCFFFSSFFF